MKHIKQKGNYTLLIILVLLVSLIINVVLSIDTYKYKYKAGKETYNSALNIRTSNETNNEILKGVVENKSINNEQLLKLYMNYSVISENISDLWYEYNYYIEEKVILDFRKIKSIDGEIGIISEVNGRIKELIKNILDLEMQTENYKINIDDNMLYMFNEMYNVSNDIKDMYCNFVDDKLKGLKDEDRVKRLINRYYWIDIFEKLNEINDKYVDIEFTLS